MFPQVDFLVPGELADQDARHDLRGVFNDLHEVTYGFATRPDDFRDSFSCFPADIEFRQARDFQDVEKPQLLLGVVDAAFASFELLEEFSNFSQSTNLREA
jgi:hypothetical protein